MHLTRRTTCRVCGSTALNRVVDLGEQCLQGSFVKPGKELPPKRAVPTSLVRCDPMRAENACGLLQMEHTVPPEILYSAYWYRSGTNATMRNHLAALAAECTSILGRTAGRVLDIGCNDGTLLAAFDGGFEKFGIDPSDIALEIEGGAQVIHDLFPSEQLVRALRDKKCDVVTSIAMFYDLEDPVQFAREIKRVLADDGLWCFEMSYMPRMLELTSYDTICHEHLEYYSLAVVEQILRRAGLSVVSASMNDINGGSLRCYATHIGNGCFASEERLRGLRAIRQSEFDLALDTDAPYKSFQDRVNAHRVELSLLLKRLKADGKRIHVYGASTKGNTILQWCGIDSHLVEVAAERNPDKFGALTLGTNIPIVSEAESRAQKPDFYLVLPWHFKREFLEREAETMRQGTAFIFPLPTVEVVTAHGLART